MAIFCAVIIYVSNGILIISLIGVALLIVLFAKNFVRLPRPTYDTIRLSIELALVIIFGYLFISGAFAYWAAFNPSLTSHESIFQLESSLGGATITFILEVVGMILVAPFVPDIVNKIIYGEWLLDRFGYIAWLTTSSNVDE